MFFFSSHFFISLFSAICSWVNVLTLICIYYFCNFAAWNGSPWTHQRKCAIRQNDFSFTQIKLVYCLTRKTLKWNSLVQKICLFLQKQPDDHFYSKNAKKLRFHVFLPFHVRKHMTSSFYLKCSKFTKSCEICSNYGSPGIRIKLEQIHNFLWIRSTSGNMMISYVF